MYKVVVRLMLRLAVGSLIIMVSSGGPGVGRTVGIGVIGTLPYWTTLQVETLLQEVEIENQVTMGLFVSWPRAADRMARMTIRRNFILIDQTT